MSGNKNKQVKEFLNYYVDQKRAPQYAVMIDGAWGSGKTWFVNQFIDELAKKECKCLYVSLYGLSDVSQIDLEFYRLLHPILSSKGLAVAGKVVKALAKGALKLDFGHHVEGNASLSVPDIDFQEFFKRSEDCILIFDDVERCLIPIGELLGYINYFVEHDGAKVILVANENEIDKRDEAEYKRIREKLIGRSFAIEGDLGAATQSFLLEIESSEIRQHVAKHLDDVYLVFEMAKYKNLRHLRQALLDFARLFALLDDTARKESRLARDLLMTLLIYTFEVKAGELEKEDLKGLSVDPFVRYFQQSQHPENPMSKLEGKYEGYLPKEDIIPGKMWAELIFSGAVDKEEFQRAIRNSAYFPRQQVEWVRLWHSSNLEDAAYADLLTEVTEKFNRGEFDEVGVLLQVVGMLISFVDRGISQDSKERIVGQAKKNLDALKAAGKIINADATGDGKYDIEYAGLGFHGSQLAEFQEVRKAIEEKVREANQDAYPEKARELMELLTKDRTKFIRKLIVNNFENAYFNVPILAYVEPTEFCENVFKASSDEQWAVQGVVEKRYEPHYRIALEPERPWLEKVATLITEEADKRKGKLSGERLARIAKSFRTEVEKWAEDDASSTQV
ncbi:hypothetical protein DN523_17260 [Burkholderia multivorans]|uniref:P-loop NTPase fold protein n=3 Tax=Burkholderia multivorans TaxID=87883 RepID=UPI000DAB6D3D|nr:P-loop NTPase fold protein [Burkholderia multivorans]RAA23858.1 hypothetical protein DN470_18310 [Burkholderia multivorans]RAA31284.1 hypothetical protein DN465_20965 [Burkholderia multivorans]RAA31552.1 hypothetical protein DN471_05605 [Burkholderia multivorans]RAA41317.1 hypothetical protein DN500_20575 [Burkholderia multivorans]RAA46322.1 hypothetical protein DN472_10685 [Burkholderia multivorans]